MMQAAREGQFLKDTVWSMKPISGLKHKGKRSIDKKKTVTIGNFNEAKTSVGR
jgi:hypothetical protein